MSRAAPLTTDALAALGTARSIPLSAVISVKFAATLTKWATRRQTGQCLDQLEIWQLDDLGLTPTAARTEARKVFWQA